ncbi:hypothetical protein BC829DRAFT_408090 [Chytridium lagenaria]|nr:hypothetical protein BC829DRAFT_408090 [Chytridium lagenaria]
MKYNRDEWGMGELEVEIWPQKMKAPATEVLLHIISYIESPFDVAQLSIVNKAWRTVACDESIWRRFCLEYECMPDDTDMDSSPPSDSLDSSMEDHSPDIEPTFTSNTASMQSPSLSSTVPSNPPSQSLFATFSAHAMQYKTLLTPYANIRRHTRSLNSFIPHLASLACLRPAAKDLGPHPIFRPTHLRDLDQRPWFPDAINATEAEKSLVLLYHLFSTGQIKVLNSPGRAMEDGYGLFGSFRCYGQLYSMYMLPRSNLLKVILKSGNTREVAVVVFAESTMLEFLGLVVPVDSSLSSDLASSDTTEATNGGGHPVPLPLRLGHFIRFGTTKKFARMGPIPSDRMPYVDLGPFDTWLEGFVNEVVAGMVEAPMYKRLTATSAFPSHGRGTASEVTSGEIIHLQTAKMCYRIAMTYLDGQCPHQSVQLLRRHWLFTSKSGHVDEVSGEGVIGAFPRLSASNPHFQYCSYSMGGPIDYSPLELDDPLVSMEGDIMFVATETATLANPQYLTVKVPRVDFVLPECH